MGTISALLASIAPLLAVFAYLSPAYALYKIAKSLDIKGAWLAWVPYANVYTIGAIADHQMKHNDGKEFKLRNILLGVQIGVVGLPIVFRVIRFVLRAFADLILLPASFCVSILTFVVTHLSDFTGAGMDLNSIWAFAEDYLWIFLIIIAVFTLLNWLTKLCLSAVTGIISFAANIVGWAVVILQYVATYKVYELFMPKRALPLLAATLALDLLSGFGPFSSLFGAAYQIFYPVVLLKMAYSKPVYKNAAEAEAPSTEAEGFDVMELPAAEPAPAMG